MKCFNGANLKELSLSLYLQQLQVGDECFKNVNEFKCVGLTMLERVVIGKGCFTQYGCKSPVKTNPDRHFYLQNCPEIREVIVGCYSFSDYAVCTISDVGKLEKVEMGSVDEASFNFQYASLALES